VSTAVSEWLQGGLPYNPDNLVLVFDTSFRDTTVEVPLFGTVNCTIDWGDGLSDSYTTVGTKTHTYAADGVYIVQVLGTLTGFGANVTRRELRACLSFGEIGLTSLSQAFRLCTNLTQVPSRLPVGVTSMSNMFTSSGAFNQDIGGWDTSNVTTFSELFEGASQFNQAIGGWDTSSVISMKSVFQSATVFNQDISGWDTSKVTTFSEMFSGASVFNQDIGSWDTGSVTSMAVMFRSARAFNQDISGWDVSKVTSMTQMFDTANAFQQPLDTWDFVGTVSLTNFMLNKTGSNRYNTPMYDDLLVRWAALVAATTLSATRSVNMGGAQFTTAGAGGTARAALITAGWTIVDGGGI
jgi:surface protein